MERIPNGRYTKVFREEAVKMVRNEGLSVLEISRRLSLPKSTLENWIRVSKLFASPRRVTIQKGFCSVLLLPRVIMADESGSMPGTEIQCCKCCLMSLFR